MPLSPTPAVPRRRSRGGLPWFVTAGGIALAVAAVITTEVLRRQHEIADATAASQAAAVNGPPCDTLTPAAFAASKLPPKKVFIFNGVRFARRYGHVDCSTLADPVKKGGAFIPVCQFTGPAVISVTTDKGEFYFEPGVGRSATVFVPDTGPRCVLAAKFGTQG